MNKKISKLIKILSISSFIIVAITSVPLFINYLKGASPKYSTIIDLHVWAGVVFIIFAVLRIIKTKLEKKK